MRVFKDKNGCDWPVEIDLATVTRVKAETGVQLIDLVLGEAGKSLASDYEALGRFLWSVNAPEAGRRSIPPEAFPSLFDGTAIDAALTAISEAVSDFLPSGRRELATKVIGKGAELMTKATAAAVARVDLLDVDQLVTRLSAGATSLAASPGSIPAT